MPGALQRGFIILWDGSAGTQILEMSPTRVMGLITEGCYQGLSISVHTGLLQNKMLICPYFKFK